MADAQNEKEPGTADATAAANAGAEQDQATDAAAKTADQADVTTDDNAGTDASEEDTGKEAGKSGSDHADKDGDDKDDAKSKDDKDTKDNEDDDLSEDVKSTVDALLDSKGLESKNAPGNVKRLVNREKDNNRRVQDTIKNAKTNPKWFVPLFVSLLIIGLAWVIVYYATSQSGPGYPIPAIGNWNLLIGFLIMLAGFIMTMWWN